MPVILSEVPMVFIGTMRRICSSSLRVHSAKNLTLCILKPS